MVLKYPFKLFENRILTINLRLLPVLGWSWWKIGEGECDSETLQRFEKTIYCF